LKVNTDGSNSQLNYLKDEVDKNILILKKKSNNQKLKTQIFTGSSIILSSLITLVLALEIADFETIQKNVALLIGALLVIVNSWYAFFDYKKLWLRQKTTLLSLYQLKNQINYQLAKNSECIEIDDLFQQYFSIWQRDGNEWREFAQSLGKDNKASKQRYSDEK
jgi:hypothetical protein